MRRHRDAGHDEGVVDRPMIRVLIVDDHPLVRRGLSDLFSGEADMEVVGTAASGEEAVDIVTQLHPDVVLMDVSMPGIGGVDATRQLHETSPDVRVVMLTSFTDRERILDSLDSGAVGYLLKDAESDELIRGVRAAARGESPLSSKAARVVLASRQEGRPADDLTSRELEVLRLLSRGLANKQIAWRLGISEKTVKTHLTNVFHAIGVQDRTQAALWAQRHNIV